MTLPDRSSPSQVLVIGAGVAGSTAAIRLAHLGHAVTLAERAVFPREKICGCCLGASGLQALDAIGAGERVRELGTPTNQWVGYLQTRPSPTGSQPIPCGGAAVRLPVAAGVAISRSVLDPLLLDQAKRAGVRVWQPCEAQVVSTTNSQTRIRYRPINHMGSCRDWQLTDEFDLVVVATGLSGVFAGGQPGGESAPHVPRWQLPWRQPPHGPLGVAAHLPGGHQLARQWNLADGEIQMVCGDEGYVGLVRLPGGAIDIAAALRSRRQRPSGQAGDRLGEASSGAPADRLAALLMSHPEISANMGQQVFAWLRDEADLMTAPPLRRSRCAGRDGVVLIGDCAGYVEPMTGEGMTWAIESGLAIADLWNGASARSDLANLWQHKLQALQRKRRILCGGVTRAMRSAWLRRAARLGLAHAPWLAIPITRGLARGATFEQTAQHLDSQHLDPHHHQ
ncbi:NAD(P)/FAD-dependent oxidoreductase [Allorhodopirellula solitaria]|uniref:FAD-binding domain-containing protein n=1 Tax=Allorhodopirellula solitaria TaxID=2527987 RepID=A0A5C5XPP3_9BACT|nr:FAD-dependent monooxygenase [Allorhodopirellula solitaria]TWT64648.1 hypothetical protein CA85_37810 [Allorhodopirellula solitaria]